MFEPAKTCPQISSVSRWGWDGINEESSEDYIARIQKAARKAARRLQKGYLDWRNDCAVRVSHPGYRLPVFEKIVCCYKEEEEVVRAVIKEFQLGWKVIARPRQSFGQGFDFMLNMIENPGWIVIADHGLNQFCWHDDVPGQPDPTPEAVTARIAFALRCAEAERTTLMGVRHQKSDGPGVAVKNMPPLSKSAETGYVNFNPPKGLGDIQQLLFFSAEIKAAWRPWNYLEDRAFALDEQRAGGKVALYEGLTVRFGETILMEDRYTGPEYQRNLKILKEEYPGKLRMKKRGSKHHG